MEQPTFVGIDVAKDTLAIFVWGQLNQRFAGLSRNGLLKKHGSGCMLGPPVEKITMARS